MGIGQISAPVHIRAVTLEHIHDSKPRRWRLQSAHLATTTNSGLAGSASSERIVRLGMTHILVL